MTATKAENTVSDWLIDADAHYYEPRDAFPVTWQRPTCTWQSGARRDEWMLYRNRSTYTGDGMTHIAGRVHAEAGRLLASFSVDSTLGAMDRLAAEVDASTAM